MSCIIYYFKYYFCSFVTNLNQCCPFWVVHESCSHAFFLHCPSSCPSSSATMGKVCFCYDILLITDNDSAIQMTKAHPLACNCKPGGGGFLPMRNFKPPTPSL